MAHFSGAFGNCPPRVIPWILAIVLIGASLAPAVDSIEGFGLSVRSLAGPDWRADGIDLDLDWTQDSEGGFRFSVQELQLPGLSGPLKGILVECPQGRFDGARLSCIDARVHLDRSVLDRPAFQAAFKGDFLNGSLSVNASQVRLAGGKLHLGLRVNPSGWHLEMRGQGLDVARLRALVTTYAALPEGWTVSGRVSPHIQVRGSGGKALEHTWNIQVWETGFSDPHANYLAEGLGGRISGHMRHRGNLWKGRARVQLAQGEILTPGFYLSPPDRPIEVKGGFIFDTGKDRFEIDSFHFLHEGVLEAKASAGFDLAQGFALRHLSLRTGRTDLQSLYGEYVQPTLAESLLEDLAWKGRAELSLNHRETGSGDLSLTLHDVHLDSAVQASSATGQPRPFGLYGVNGRLTWNRGGTPEASSISWQGGHILDRLTLGPARMEMILSDNKMQLAEPAEIPVLDGRLLVDRFSVAQVPDGGRHLRFDGVLTPISLQRLSRALGWPELAGKLSGVIPEVSYRDGRLLVAGNLLVHAFGGDILIRRLRIQDLSGIFPILNADMEFKDLDLEVLTRTFSFGKITGRLEGVIQGLQLEDWRPVAFDARFATPEDDDSRHRISQKAVDNISNLGGAGVSGALSRGFLRFFDDFGYKRLGISCRLRNGVCEMGGVSPAQNGYYLVEGGGIPRISIIGFNRRTDWQLLLDQLRAISAADSAVVD